MNSLNNSIVTLGNGVSRLRNNIYFKLFMYIIDLMSILSIIYININASNFKLCMGNNQSDIKNYIDINYLWVLIAMIILKNIFIIYTKETDDLIQKVVLTLTKLVLNICSGGLILLSYNLYHLQTDYIDSIRLKFNFHLVRIWNKDELKEYLLNRVFTNPTILEKFKNLGLELPFSEKRTSHFLIDCNTIGDVNKSVTSIVKKVQNEQEMLEKARAAGVINELTERINTLESSLPAASTAGTGWMFWGCTVGAVLIVALIFAMIVALKDEADIKGNKIHDVDNKIHNVDNQIHNVDDKVNIISEKVDGALKTLAEVRATQDIDTRDVTRRYPFTDNLRVDMHHILNIRGDIASLEDKHHKNWVRINNTDRSLYDTKQTLKDTNNILDRSLDKHYKAELLFKEVDKNIEALEKKVGKHDMRELNTAFITSRYIDNLAVLDTKFTEMNSVTDATLKTHSENIESTYDLLLEKEEAITKLVSDVNEVKESVGNESLRSIVKEILAEIMETK